MGSCTNRRSHINIDPTSEIGTGDAECRVWCRGEYMRVDYAILKRIQPREKE